MGRMYVCPMPAVAVTAAQDLYEVLSPADSTTKLWEIHVSQSGSTTSTQVRMTLKYVTGAPTSGSGGSTITPSPVSPGDAAYGGTVERNNTVRISGGTSTTKIDEGFNFLNGFEWIATSEKTAYEASPSTYLVLGLETVVTMTLQGYLVLEEIGG